MFRTNPWSNKFLVIAVIASLLLTASLCYAPILQVMFDTVPLGVYDWAFVLFTASWGLLVLPEVFMGRRGSRP